MALNRISGPEDLYVGGIFALRKPDLLRDKNITAVLSVIKYSFAGWGEEANRFRHMSIDVDDMDDEDLLAHLSSAVRFIDRELHPPPEDHAGTSTTPGAVFVHCAMGKSRSVTCVVAWLLYKYPSRFGGKPSAATAVAPSSLSSSSSTAAQRRQTAKQAVAKALRWFQESSPIAEPNDGFMRQLELWWEMGCPADDDRAVENHPVYQRWLYENKLKEARDLHMAPDADWIRFEDEEEAHAEEQPGAQDTAAKELRCKKCRRVLANSKFVVNHHGTGEKEGSTAPCPHVFVETLSWMRPHLEDGALDGRLNCPNPKCGSIVGRFAWQGFKCSCGEWVSPAFSLNRSKVDEAAAKPAGMGIRMPPGRNGSL